MKGQDPATAFVALFSIVIIVLFILPALNNLRYSEELQSCQNQLSSEESKYESCLNDLHVCEQNKETCEQEKQFIMNDLTSCISNLDLCNIENEDLRNQFIECEKNITLLDKDLEICLSKNNRIIVINDIYQFLMYYVPIFLVISIPLSLLNIKIEIRSKKVAIIYLFVSLTVLLIVVLLSL